MPSIIGGDNNVLDFVIYSFINSFMIKRGQQDMILNSTNSPVLGEQRELKSDVKNRTSNENL